MDEQPLVRVQIWWERWRGDTEPRAAVTFTQDTHLSSGVLWVLAVQKRTTGHLQGAQSRGLTATAAYGPSGRAAHPAAVVL